MNLSRKEKIGLFLIGPLALIVSTFRLLIALSSYRLLCLPIYLTACGLYFSFKFHRRARLLIAVAVLFFISTLLTVDISLINAPGPPHLAELVMGFPRKEDFEAAKRGEMVVGGCLVSGNEPKWLLVW